MNLCRLVCVNKPLVTVGHLSQAGNSNAKTFAKDPKFVVKLPVNSIEGRDFEHHQKDKVEFSTEEHLNLRLTNLRLTN